MGLWIATVLALLVLHCDVIQPQVLQTSPLMTTDMEQGDRKLGQYAQVAPMSASTPGIGCVTLNLTLDQYVDVASPVACGGNKCPPCFAINATQPYTQSAAGAQTCGGPAQVLDVEGCRRAYEVYDNAMIAKSFTVSLDRADYPNGCWYRKNVASGVVSFIFNINVGSFTSFNTDAADVDKLVCVDYRKLTIGGCSSMKMGNFGSRMSSAVIGLDFMNTGSGDFKISDGISPSGETDYVSFAGRSAKAMCGTWSGNVLAFQQ